MNENKLKEEQTEFLLNLEWEISYWHRQKELEIYSPEHKLRIASTIQYLILLRNIKKASYE